MQHGFNDFLSLEPINSFAFTGFVLGFWVVMIDQAKFGGALGLLGRIRRLLVRRDAFGDDLVERLAEGQRLALGDQVGHQQIVLFDQRVVRLGETDEVDRHQPGALVQQLIERVLTVRARFAPHDRAGRRGER